MLRVFASVLVVFFASFSVANAAAQADRIVIEKGERRMTLYNGDETLATYRIALGFAPVGDKLREGDGKTPEGRYRIDLKNPQSQFHLSLRISYPDAADRAGADSTRRQPRRGYLHSRHARPPRALQLHRKHPRLDPWLHRRFK